MNRIIVSLVALSLAESAPAAAQGNASPAAAARTKAEQELLDLSGTKWRWMSERKVDSLAALFHEEAVFVHMGGSMSRTQELEVIRSDGIHYKHAEIFDASVRFIGPTAIVLNRIRLDAVVGVSLAARHSPPRSVRGAREGTPRVNSHEIRLVRSMATGAFARLHSLDGPSRGRLDVLGCHGLPRQRLLHAREPPSVRCVTRHRYARPLNHASVA